ncbi:MAG: thioredoxin family protein, partial [Pseudolabrys sp.]|nr:thioredoxin family protein [Pseudolabrys sp.]
MLAKLASCEPRELACHSTEPHGAMFTKFCKLITVSAFLLGSAFAVQAGQPFNEKVFKQAQADGKAVLVHVTAPWCPTCRQQRPIVEEIEKQNPSLMVYEVDFDTAKDTLKRFRVQYQSTLIMFRGEKEAGR